MNESVSCKAAIVDLTDSGQLSLKCADGFIKWSPDTITVYSTDVSKPESEECYFLDSPEIRNDWEKRLKLGLRCMKIRSPKYTFGYGARAISFDDLKCGVRNASSVALIESSDTCWSQTNNNLNTDSTIFHSLRLIDEDYYKDYKDVRKKRFKARKLEIENKWNRLYLTNSSIFLNAGFESLIVSEMKQPENMSIPGVFVTAIVLFALPISKSSYLDEWNRLSDDDGILEEWTVSDTSILQAALTCPAISSLQSKMSADLWEASTLDSNIQPKVGTTIDFQCPSGKQLSIDSDGYHANDDKFTVLCTTRGNYEVPRNWPTCVRFCPIRMPYKPLSKTGLVGVEGLNTVPSGKYGRYICQDTSLGVDRGPSEFFKVQCNPDGYYDVPKNVRDWPICMARTTTMSPVLPVALKNMMSAFTQRLEFRLEAYAWTGDGPKIETKTENYLLKIVAPVAGSKLHYPFFTRLLCIHFEIVSYSYGSIRYPCIMSQS